MSEKDVIFYVADESNPLPEIVKQTLHQEGYPLKAYQPDTPLGQAFFLFSPIWDGKYYQSVESVWEKFMAKNFPDSKLLVIGSLPGDDPNYADAFNLPKDWGKTIAALPPASRFTGKAPVFTNGLNMEERLRRFLMGHGDDSLMDVCREIKIIIEPWMDVVAMDNNGSLVMEAAKDLRFGPSRTHWKTLLTRWQNFQPLFVFLPFHNTFEGIDRILSALGVFFEAEDFEESQIKPWLEAVVPNLNQLHDLLNELNEYVRE